MEDEKVLIDTPEEEVVALNEEVIEEFDDEDVNVQDIKLEDEEDNKAKAEEESKPKKQSASENAKYAAARKDAEAKQKEAETKLIKVLQTSGVSSYEELASPFVGLSDKRKEELRNEALDKGEDEDDYVEKHEVRAFIKRQKAIESAKVAQDALKKEVNSRVATEKQEFQEAYPAVDLNKLIADTKFSKLAKPLYGRMTLKEIYELKLELSGEAETIALQKSVSKAERSTSSGATASTVLNSRQQTMLKNWNDENPDMIMTEKEFSKP
jgi:hypothetical protein